MEEWSATSSSSSPIAFGPSGTLLARFTRRRSGMDLRLRMLGRVDGGLKAEMRVMLIQDTLSLSQPRKLNLSTGFDEQSKEVAAEIFRCPSNGTEVVTRHRSLGTRTICESTEL